MRTTLGLGLVAVLLTGCQGEEAGDVPTTEEFGGDGIGTELANDPRVDVTTTQEAVAEGRDMDYWEGPDL